MRTCSITPPRRSIGLLLLFRSDDGERSALLRVREHHDPETGGRQSFAGLTQVTIHGVVEGEEGMHEAIRRELAEELREMFRASGEPHDPAIIKEGLLCHFPGRLHALMRRDTDDERIITLGCILHQTAALRGVQPLLRSNQLRIVRKSELPGVRIIDPSDPAARTEAIPPGEIAMFPDEYEALKRAFDMPDPA